MFEIQNSHLEIIKKSPKQIIVVNGKNTVVSRSPMARKELLEPSIDRMVDWAQIESFVVLLVDRPVYRSVDLLKVC